MKLDIHIPEIDRLNAKVKAVSERIGPTELERLEAKIQTVGERFRPKSLFRDYTIEDVFNPLFMMKHTDFPDLPTFLGESGLFPDDAATIDDAMFKKVVYEKRSEFNEFVRSSSRTNDWDSLRTLALTEFVGNIMEIGLLMIISGT